MAILTFLDLNNEEEKQFVKEIYEQMEELLDDKKYGNLEAENQKNSAIFQQQILHDTLTKRPFCKQLTYLLLENR